MQPAERERVEHLLAEMGRLNDQLSVVHRATVRELALTRHQLSTQQNIVDLIAVDHSPQAAIALAQYLLDHGQLDQEQRDLAERVQRSGDELAALSAELIERVRRH
ncbi:hypothetical protein NOCA240023 [metagenome]|uniref:Uncharacterized protein n=1 Tax=metagenome TaxID=256318 RepID=A0A2P2C5K3_9ZZZZ